MNQVLTALPKPARIASALAAAVAVLALTACSTVNPAAPQPSPGSSTTNSGSAGKPNVIYVLTDDLATNLLPYMPNVQALQKRGTTFSNYFVVDSLCCPSRSAILTGQYPHNNGVFTNSGADGGYQTFRRRGDEKHTFGTALQQAGYRTGFMGKYLNGYQPTDPVPPGWNEWDVAGNGYPEYNYTLNENGSTKKYGRAPQDYLTDVISGKASGFIDQSAKDQKPFMLELATFAPHGPATPAPRDRGDFPKLKAPQTPAYDKTSSDAPDWLSDRAALTSKQKTMIDNKFRKRAKSVQAVDDMIGKLTEQLKAKGMLDNTYVVFNSDNGFHMGEHRLLPGKQTAFDTDIRVPLVVAGPGIKAGSTTSSLASNIDLAPTFAALGGATVDPNLVDGTSLVPLLRGEKPKGWRESLLIEHHGPTTAADDPDKQTMKSGNPPTYEAVRTANATYVSYRDAKTKKQTDEEYYDLEKDPDQLHNLADSASDKTLDPIRDALEKMEACRGQKACTSASMIG